MPHARDLALLALAWGAYFAIHSALASLRVKAWVDRRLGRIARAYRLLYSLLALALLAVPVALLLRLAGPPLWSWPGPLRWLADGLALAALAGFVWTLRDGYDGAAFLGLRQLRHGAGAADEGQGLRLTTLHRWVRHPWYSLGLVILWTRPMDAALLVTALCITAYVVVGSRLEERRLVARYGEVYRAYARRVPALVPRPWRHLSAEEAAALEAAARDGT
ncbi:methyltransferase family protein [Inmirania thermothiophila]|uniref:Protein-S-isoprenylcysteine O-methyltransferase Ste14 n=1 Tax=Inmirania thermothiophila TaxID=1750597 RepID=A0A3N1Y842_9GAMM|nr:hypothetical protein [Inmirania thermothiophila]ROR34984.1 protein-S-isoprenylcysteine O-methyltransferase Ste14 [Inmirania thermothiophila]